MDSRDPHDVVHLVTATNPAHAHIIRQALQREGIESHVVGEYLDAGIGDIPGVQPEVWVHRDDLERAKAVLSETDKAEGEEDQD